MNFTHQSLSSMYDEATTLYHHLDQSTTTQGQQDAQQCMALFEQCNQAIRSESVFSENETLPDLSTRRLSYMLVPLRLAQLQDQVQVDLSNGPTPRLRLLQRSDIYFELFLRTCTAYKVAEDADVQRHQERLAQKSNGTDITSSMNRLTMNLSRQSAEVARQQKIDTFRRQTRSRKRMAEIERIKQKRQSRQSSASSASSGTVKNHALDDEYLLDGDDEELEREHVLLLLQSGARDALDTLDAHGQEIPMLAHMAQMREKQAQKGGNNKDPRIKAKREEQRKKQLLEEYKNRPGLSLTHISPDGSVRKEQLKSQVFRPGHNQPTMGLEEFADMEVADAMAR